MIPLDFITEWRRSAPWIHDSQVEQDLILRAGEKITSGFRIPSSRRLRPLLNREILTVARLRLRFRSIVATKSDANLGAKTGSYFFADP